MTALLESLSEANREGCSEIRSSENNQPTIDQVSHTSGDTLVKPSSDNTQTGSANFFNQSWDECFTQFRDFKDKNRFGASRPRDIEGRFLTHWSQMQRHLRREGRLTDEQIRRLEEIGFDWGPSKQWRAAGSRTVVYDEQWHDSYNQLVAFKAAHGHCDVPATYSDNLRLGRWISAQRTAHRFGRLSEKRFQQLNEIGFIWKKPPKPRKYQTIRFEESDTSVAETDSSNFQSLTTEIQVPTNESETPTPLN